MPPTGRRRRADEDVDVSKGPGGLVHRGAASERAGARGGRGGRGAGDRTGGRGARHHMRVDGRAPGAREPRAARRRAQGQVRPARAVPAGVVREAAPARREGGAAADRRLERPRLLPAAPGDRPPLAAGDRGPLLAAEPLPLGPRRPRRLLLLQGRLRVRRGPGGRPPPARRRDAAVRVQGRRRLRARERAPGRQPALRALRRSGTTAGRPATTSSAPGRTRRRKTARTSGRRTTCWRPSAG